MPHSIKSIVLLFIICVTVFASCTYRLYTKKEVVKMGNKNKFKKTGKMVIEGDGNTIQLQEGVDNVQKINETYHFADDGSMLKYTLISSCDTCYHLNLSKTLKSNAYKWKQLNDSTYLSAYYLKRMLNIHASALSYEIVQHNFSRKECSVLIKNAKK